MLNNQLQTTPIISVIMPVYNSEDFVKEAIESILQQTFSDFEFLIYDDGSTDKTHEIINTFNDDRIVYKKIEKNSGYLNLLNDGLAIANGKYIARMDADDIALPNRFEEQFKFLEENTDVGICGSWSEFIGQNKGIGKTPVSSDAVIYSMFFGSPMAHPTIMMRTEMMRQFSLKYNSDFYLAEDYKLFSEAFLYFKIVNIPKVLLKYRIHSLQVSSKNWRTQFDHKSNIQAQLFINCLSGDPAKNYSLLFNFLSEKSIPVYTWLNAIDDLRIKIIEGNANKEVYPQHILERATNDLFKKKINRNFYNYFYNKYYNQKNYSSSLLISFLKEKYKPYRFLGKKMTAYFVVKCLIGYHKKTILSS